MIWIVASVVLLIIVLGILAAVTQIAEYPELLPTVATLNLEQAEHQHYTALKTAARRYEKKPNMSMNRKEFEYYLTLAVLTKDRVQQLSGLPNGPKIRKKWRRELVAEIREIARENDMERI